MIANGSCPFVDEGDGRCSCRMTKQSLAQAFDYCLGGRHFACQTYHTISWELRANADDTATHLQHGAPTQHPGTPPQPKPARPAAVALTLAGQPLPTQPRPQPQALPIRGTG